MLKKYIYIYSESLLVYSICYTLRQNTNVKKYFFGQNKHYKKTKNKTLLTLFFS